MNVSDIINQAGGTVKLAERIGVHPSTVSGWLRKERISIQYAITINREMGIPLAAMRPDVWGGTM